MAKAIGFVETRGLAISIEVADVMLKNANIKLVKQSMVDAAQVTILVEGDVSAVKIAVEAGKNAAERMEALLAYKVIARPDVNILTLVD